MLALAAATLLTSAGPAAAGSGYGQLIVNPGTAAPGQTVSILGVCPTNGSTLTGVRSTAFVGGAASITIGSENFTGKATISGSTPPGTYTVKADCGSGSPSVNIVVTAASSPKPTTAPTTTQPRTTPAMPPSTHASTPQTSGAAPRTSSAGAMGGTAAHPGGTTPAPGMSSPTASSMSSPTGTTAAPAVTSTGVIRVGLAGNSSPLSGMLPPVLIAAAFAVACAVGFLLHRRRRTSHETHE